MFWIEKGVSLKTLTVMHRHDRMSEIVIHSKTGLKIISGDSKTGLKIIF